MSLKVETVYPMRAASQQTVCAKYFSGAVCQTAKLLEQFDGCWRFHGKKKIGRNSAPRKNLFFRGVRLVSIMRRKPRRQQVRLLATVLLIKVRAFVSVGGGGRKRQNRYGK